jgi:gliding motility associated protien GldN
MANTIRYLIPLLLLYNQTNAQLVQIPFDNELYSFDSIVSPYKKILSSEIKSAKWVFNKIKVDNYHQLFIAQDQKGKIASLSEFLLDLVREEKIQAYDEDIASNDIFDGLMNIKDVEDKWGAKDEVIMIENAEDPEGPMIEKTICGEINTTEIKEYLIAELWLFGLNDQILQKRIVGICPIRFFVIDSYDNSNEVEHVMSKIAWFYYPEIRSQLINLKTYDKVSGHMDNSIDNFFVSRKYKDSIVETLPISPKYFRKETDLRRLDSIDFSNVNHMKIRYSSLLLNDFNNLRLYLPEDEGNENKSLIDVFLDGITSHGLVAYEEYNNDEFSRIITLKEIEHKFGAEDQVVMVENVEDPEGPMIQKTIEGIIYRNEIKEYIIEEVLFYNKSNKLINSRLIAICPIRYFENRYDERGALKKRKVFWLKYNECRKLLASNFAMNISDKDSIKSFDDIFTNKDYSSAIIDEKWINLWDIKKLIDIGALTGEVDKSLFDINIEKLDSLSSDLANAKIIYKKINLADSINFPLYYPDFPHPYYKSLIEVILFGIRYAGVLSYADEYFNSSLTIDAIENKMGAEDQVIMVENPEDPDGPMIEALIEGEIHFNEIKEYIIKEVCFYDNSNKFLNSKIIAICPIRHYYEESDSQTKKNKKTKVFWIDYSQYKKQLSHTYAISVWDSELRTFDKTLSEREYTSTTVKERNINLWAAKKMYFDNDFFKPLKENDIPKNIKYQDIKELLSLYKRKNISNISVKERKIFNSNLNLLQKLCNKLSETKN